jgi:DNA-binding winged helix-turn-helix (wHTH) protein
VFRFGPFEFDPKSGQLRSESGTHLLADQPLALLTALLERPGEMVSREELRLRLWPEGTFVDFDHGLNSAVSRLREALKDSANTPRFVETIPRRGYRLLVPVEAEGPVLADAVAPTPPLPADDAAQQAAPVVAREPAMAWAARHRGVLAWMGVAATGLFTMLVVGVVQSRRDAGRVPLLASFVIDLPDEWQILNESPAISPDSRHIIFSAWNPRAGSRAIWHRPLDAGAVRMLPATEDGSAPFWSPDGKSIGFFAEGKLKTIPLAGGSARVVCDAALDATGTWIKADVILFAPGPTGAVSAVTVEHGAVRPITKVDRSSGELQHVRPTSLPDRRHFVYLVNRKDQLVATLASVDGTDALPLGTVQSHVVADPSGLVVFIRDGALMAQRLDVAAGRLTGDATVLAERLTQLRGFYGRFSTSPAVLVYLKGRRQLDRSELRIFDRAGKTVGTVGEPVNIRRRVFHRMACAWPWRAAMR